MSFETHQLNLQSMQSYLKEEKEKQNSTGITWWSIPKGMSSIRILPPWDPTGRIALSVNMHPIEYQAPESKYKKYNWTCLNRTFNKPCKICEGLRALSNAGVDISKYDSTRRQFYINAIIMLDPRYREGGNEGVAPGTHVILRAPKTLYDWIISQITNPLVGDITSIKSGIDVYVTKEGSGLGTEYKATLSPNGRTAIPEEFLEKIDTLHNLDDIFSTGFEDNVIEGLMNNLKNAAGIISREVPNVVENMATKNSERPTPVSSLKQTIAPNPYESQNTQLNNQVKVTPPNSLGYTTNEKNNPPEKVSNHNPEGAPRCFGQYDAKNVTCVVCNFESDCSKASK